jgi:hypothetical protein
MTFNFTTIFDNSATVKRVASAERDVLDGLANEFDLVS